MNRAKALIIGQIQEEVKKMHEEGMSPKAISIALNQKRPGSMTSQLASSILIRRYGLKPIVDNKRHEQYRERRDAARQGKNLEVCREISKMTDEEWVRKAREEEKKLWQENRKHGWIVLDGRYSQ